MQVIDFIFLIDYKLIETSIVILTIQKKFSSRT